MVPVVRDRVGAEPDQVPGGQFVFNRLRVGESRNPEERRQLSLVVAERGTYIDNAFVDFILNERGRQFAKSLWMILAVRADAMTFRKHTAYRGGIGARHFANHEKRRFHALRRKDVEDLIGVA